MKDYLFTSARLGFRYWEETDLVPFCEMGKDPEVMQFFPATLPEQDSIAMVARIRQHFSEKGYGLYAVDLLSTQKFIGFIGLSTPRFDAYFTPCTEIGWRLRRDAWGRGLATEGAIRCLSYAFETFDFSEIYSFTAVINQPSERVMQKAGMQQVGTFQHPMVADDSPLKAHVLYRMARPGSL
ncbi:GNAT family N-acetyltransferase [Chitinophaga arvensicola]|uniref:Ribosomal-protein-alanine N-acetyltransferase n=1 Tax=Chitinophaga arvensicola TaxID=29529 RepID=A0A1I0RHI7_9BACT|nr:GNAT family N-acetyltransferase [Chitinophaga arvensicola]SEW39717.1 ribosomal-protein-alanine N-acetyltransferase [Chitinophaga arvensicola]